MSESEKILQKAEDKVHEIDVAEQVERQAMFQARGLPATPDGWELQRGAEVARKIWWQQQREAVRAEALRASHEAQRRADQANDAEMAKRQRAADDPERRLDQAAYETWR